MKTGQLKIAISGPAASGKGTIAKLLATRFDLKHVDAGMIFRLGAYCVREGVIHSFPELISLYERGIWDCAQSKLIFAGCDLTVALANPEIALLTARMSDRADTFHALAGIVNRALEEESRVVVDGRNAGGVILPDADVKIHLCASVNVRAVRRLNDLTSAGLKTSFAQVEQSIRERDCIDAQRAVCPMTVPLDAISLTTDRQKPYEVAEDIARIIHLKGFC